MSGVDVAAFVLARLAEDEQVAQLVADSTYGGVVNVELQQQITATRREMRTVAVYDPARVLADVAAKRAIVEEHAPVQSHFVKVAPGISREEMEQIHKMTPPRTLCAVCITGMRRVDYPCHTLRLLAQPYADHEDYDPAWTVTT